MWAMRLNIVDWGYFKIQTLQGILKTQINIRRSFVEHFLEVEHSYRSVGCARSKRQYLTAPQIVGCCLRVDGLLALDLWDLVIEVLGTTHRILKQTQVCTRLTGAETQSTPKIKQVLNQNVDLSNIDQVPSNAHLSEKESQLYISEDNEAMIKMIVKGRSPTMRHVSTHRVACSHFSNSHSFLSAGKQSEMSKRSQESSSLGSPTAKAKACCLVSQHFVSVGQDYSSNPKIPESTSDSQVWTSEERSAMVQKILEVAQKRMPR